MNLINPYWDQTNINSYQYSGQGPKYVQDFGGVINEQESNLIHISNIIYNKL